MYKSRPENEFGPPLFNLRVKKKRRSLLFIVYNIVSSSLCKLQIFCMKLLKAKTIIPISIALQPPPLQNGPFNDFVMMLEFAHKSYYRSYPWTCHLLELTIKILPVRKKMRHQLPVFAHRVKQASAVFFWGIVLYCTHVCCCAWGRICSRPCGAWWWGSWWRRPPHTDSGQ